MIRTALFIACALPLAACDSGPEVSAENASVEEVAQKVEAAGGSANFVNPGKWQSTVAIEEITLPGVPADVAKQMNSIQGRTQTSEQCLTAEEAKRPNEDFFGGKDNCRYERFNMGNGKIDAVMKCSESGATQIMTMAGTYSGDSYNLQMTTRSEGGDEAGIAMKMRFAAKRVGPCTEKAS